MEAVVGLLVMLLGVSHGVQTCDGRKNGAQCYGALGETVVLQLMNDTSGIFRFDCTKNKTNILRWDQTKIVYNLIEDHSPVSSVRLVSECLSQGLKKVSCSSEGGDSPQYSWTLDGHTLTDTELLSGNNETNVIVLNQNVSGRLVCSVRNHVSRVSKEETISTCDFSLLICGVKAAVAVVSFVGIVVYFTWKKKKSQRAEGSTVPPKMENPDRSVLMVEVNSEYEL
ncbi:uncharacterized protein LOC113144774 [Mastacembelus armatus]|uniref:uncharacterized protein LOC113144774 n=1 Tax=Mastacembelus armatus TaxID=205130 RepID=UPI000E459469|nr:uncharacterized protein LOC113144774 [Mastacembelus armatus]